MRAREAGAGEGRGVRRARRPRDRQGERPKYRPLRLTTVELPSNFNLLFFGHFAELSRERYVAEMAQTLKPDGSIYAAMSNDIYSLGTLSGAPQIPLSALELLSFFSPASCWPRQSKSGECWCTDRNKRLADTPELTLEHTSRALQINVAARSHGEAHAQIAAFGPGLFLYATVAIAQPPSADSAIPAAPSRTGGPGY